MESWEAIIEVRRKKKEVTVRDGSNGGTKRWSWGGGSVC